MAITLNTKAYNFAGILNGISQYFERTGGVAAAFSALTARVTPATKNNKSIVAWKLKLPIVADEASSCSCPGDVVRESIADLHLQMHAGATVAERTDFALRVKDLVASPEFQASIINLNQPAS